MIIVISFMYVKIIYDMITKKGLTMNEVIGHSYDRKSAGA